MLTQGPTSYEEHNARYPLHIRRYVAGQFLAYYAYQLASAKPAIEKLDILMVDGSFKPYLVKPFKLKSGMHAFLLLPEDRSQADFKLIIRGTDFTDSKSIAINLEPDGPGTRSFEQEKDNLFDTLNTELIAHYGTLPELTMDICGHSQGAVLSQLFAAEFLKRRAASDKYDHFTALNMTVFNSPGVPDYVAEDTLTALLLQMYDGKDIKIVANYGMVGGDVVQTTGFNTIFADLSHVLAEVNLLKVDVGMEGNWLKDIHLADGIQPREVWDALQNAYAALLGAHSTTNFYAPLDEDRKIKVNSKYEFYSNKNQADLPKIHEELHYKAVYTQRMLYLLKIALLYFIEHKDDSRLFSWMSVIRNTLGTSFIEHAYAKLMGWFGSRVANITAHEQLALRKSKKLIFSGDAQDKPVEPGQMCRVSTKSNKLY